MTMKQILLFLGNILILVNALPPYDNAPIIITPLGTLKGTIMQTRLGKPIYSFRGIRYAQAQRFEPPVPVHPWGDVYQATNNGASCPQDKNVTTSEDCLFLNVYTNTLLEEKVDVRKPVIVFLHPSAFNFLSGSSVLFGPEYLLDEDVILVIPNYRLGALGFLSTGTKEAPGNNAFKDQVLALKWVKYNIASFGGNPDLVTLAGYSSGGESAALHLVSPMSKGLFHRAMLMSGAPFGNIPVPPHRLDLAKKQARLVNCPDDSPQKIIACLKTKPAKEIVDTITEFREFGIDPVVIWTPVIEPNFGQERFLTAHPNELVLKGKFEQVPIYTGLTTDEVGGRAFFLTQNETLLKSFDENYESLWPIIFNYERDTENSKRISKGLRNFYFDGKSIDKSSLSRIANLYSDSIVGFSVDRGVKLLAQKNSKPVYYYRFNYKGRYTFFYVPGTNETIPYGVSHQDDLMYVFYLQQLFPFFNSNDPEVKMVEKMTRFWANFAKTGKPIEDETWSPFNIITQKYLDIADEMVIRDRLYEDRFLTWEKLFPLSVYE